MIKDDSLAIFRRFDEINLINLLYLQNEIQILMDEFTSLCPDDVTSGDNAVPRYMLASYVLRGGGNPVNAKDDDKEERCDIMTRLRLKIREYSEIIHRGQGASFQITAPR
jgi:hypothetical protein